MRPSDADFVPQPSLVVTHAKSLKAFGLEANPPQPTSPTLSFGLRLDVPTHVTGPRGAVGTDERGCHLAAEKFVRFFTRAPDRSYDQPAVASPPIRLQE